MKNISCVAWLLLLTAYMSGQLARKEGTIPDTDCRKQARLTAGHAALIIAFLLTYLLIPASPARALLPGKLPGQPSGADSALQSAAENAGDYSQTLQTVREKLNEAELRHQEISLLLAAKNPPSYALPDELSVQQTSLLATRMALEAWLLALKNIQKVRQAEHDLENTVQSWTGFGLDEPYPLSLADQLSAELRSKQLELQTEQARAALEEDKLSGFRKALEQTGAKVRKAAETLEQSAEQHQARARWLMEAAEAQQQLAEARLQTALARVEHNKNFITLQEREIDFLEEKLTHTLGKTEFTRTDLDARLKTIADDRNRLEIKLKEAQRQDKLTLGQVTNARENLEKEIAGGGQELDRLRRLFELRQVEADTASQQVETLELLLAGNSLEAVLWQARFQVHSGFKQNQNLSETLRNIDAWQERLSEFKDYYSSKSQLIRSQIQTQHATLNSWSELQPGKQLEQTKLEAYKARLIGLEELLASTETLDFLTDRLRYETSAKKYARPFLERLQIALTGFFQKISSAWNYEIFSVDDTIIVDGRIISGSRPVTLNKLIYGLLLLTVGVWLVGKVSKLLSSLAQRRTNVERSLILLFEKTGQFVAILIVVVVALGLVRIPFTAFAFLGGALAIGVGFGGQNLINNFLSSLILLVEQPIKIGDIVETEGVLGRVTKIGGRCSTIRRFDGVDLLVPNSHLLETTVVNRTLSDNLVRHVIQVGVAYGSPTREVFRILDQVMEEHGLVLKEPKPVSLLEDFAADALLFGIYYWVEVNERLDARVIASDLRHRIDRLFRDAGISIAFPQRDVHLDADKPLKIELVADQQPEKERVRAEN